MKEIPLTKGYVAIVDDDDYEWLMKRKWCAATSKRSPHKVYAITRGVPKNVLMHRAILGVTDPKIQVDHRDNFGLNNQRSNLREATHAQNMRNATTRVGLSKFKGVSKCSKSGKWRARITFGKEITIGRFGSEIEAAMAYDAKAKELYQDFAYLNFK